MKKRQLTPPFLIFIAIFLSGISSSKNLFGQAPIGALEDHFTSVFNKRLSPQIKLYNGVSYLGYAGRLQGNAYLDDNTDFVKGTVTYEGFVFKDVPILFDLVEGKVVSILYDGYSKYSLISERLSNFTIGERTFVYLPERKIEKNAAKNYGFFELPYSGKIKVLVSRTKSIKEILEVQGAIKQFNQEVEYFIMHNNQLYKVNSESAFIRLFENHKEDLKNHIKSNKLKFREDPIKALVSLASYYEQLSN